jgi:hypothetical protein
MAKMQKSMDYMVKRIEELENQPAEAKGVVLVAKNSHEGDTGSEQPDPVEALLKMKGLTPEGYAREYMKIQLANGSKVQQ